MLVGYPALDAASRSYTIRALPRRQRSAFPAKLDHPVGDHFVDGAVDVGHGVPPIVSRRDHAGRFARTDSGSRQTRRQQFQYREMRVGHFLRAGLRFARPEVIGSGFGGGCHPGGGVTRC